MIIVPLEERFGDGGIDVVTNKVGELQKAPSGNPPRVSPHRSVPALLGLHESQGLEVERPGDAVHDESRRVVDPWIGVLPSRSATPST